MASGSRTSCRVRRDFDHRRRRAAPRSPGRRVHPEQGARARWTRRDPGDQGPDPPHRGPRRGEVLGRPADNIHFLDLPFYETGRVRRSRWATRTSDHRGPAEKVKPHQIYAAGDLSDPHGTHRSAWPRSRGARRLADEAWMPTARSGCTVARGRSGVPHEIEMAVPLSPSEVERKRMAIFKHESQKDRALFPGPVRHARVLAAGRGPQPFSI
jgi:hypothetical protein